MLGIKIIEERESKFNGHLRVVKSFGLGTYIQAEGLTQSGGIVEGMWKQTLGKLKNLRTKEPKDVLILGLGGGTVAKFVSKFWPDAKIVGVDIDPVIVELGIKYLKLNINKVKVIIGNASNTPNLPNFPNQKFDLIIVDLYNGDKFPQKFKKDEFIKLILKLISDDGVAIFNHLYFKDKRADAEDFGKKLKNVFGKVEYYRPITNMMFICSK